MHRFKEFAQKFLSNSVGSATRLAACVALLLSLGACASVETQSEDPAQLFKAAEEEIRNDHYLMATDKLRELKNKFPYSKQAVDAQLRLADVYFLQELFSEAAAAYESFRDLHPKHEKAPYALFRTGKSYMLDSPSETARDLASAERALRFYAEYLAKYPSDPLAEEVRADQMTLQARLAEKELGIANFYRKQGRPKAAQRRFERIVARFPNTSAAERAKIFLSQMAEPEATP